MNSLGLALTDFAIEHPLALILIGLLGLALYIYIIILEVRYG